MCLVELHARKSLEPFRVFQKTKFGLGKMVCDFIQRQCCRAYCEYCLLLRLYLLMYVCLNLVLFVL